MTESQIDTLVIGAGVIGSSIAMHLAEAGVQGVRCVDFDLEGGLSSSELNAGGVRATLSLPLNVELSRDSLLWFGTVAQDVGYRPCGYLWLHAPERMKGASLLREQHLKQGWDVRAWDVPELKRHVPFIDKTEGIAGAFFSPQDGLINPNLLKMLYRSRARAAGAVFEDRTLVRASETRANGVRVEAERFEQVLSHETKQDVLCDVSTDRGRTRVVYQAKRVVNAAGPWAALVARVLGYASPVRAVRRQVSIFDCKDVDLTPYGMIVDTSGVYFHPEATNGLAGFAPTGEPDGYNYSYDGPSFFEEYIWPALYERSTGFEKLKHLSGWAGLYEVSPDESAILGEVRGLAPGRVFEAHSFSGHGVMQSYAAGRAVAELLTQGGYRTLDCGPLEGGRFEAGRLMSETAVI